MPSTFTQDFWNTARYFNYQKISCMPQCYLFALPPLSDLGLTITVILDPHGANWLPNGITEKSKLTSQSFGTSSSRQRRWRLLDFGSIINWISKWGQKSDHRIFDCPSFDETLEPYFFTNRCSQPSRVSFSFASCFVKPHFFAGI